MKTITLPLLLLLVFLAACVPGSAPLEIATSTTAAPALTEAIPTGEDPDTVATDPQPLATSRGPDLTATDPTNVTLASGGLQLVEFFRFT